MASISFALCLGLSFSFAVRAENNCTAVQKAFDTLEFSDCWKNLYYYGHAACREVYSVVVEPHPNSSCDFLRHLVDVCGKSYDQCHTPEEKKEIMRMWIKQFIRETLKSLWWTFDDKYPLETTGGISIKSGECDTDLGQYFETSEIEEIKSFIGEDNESFSPYYDKNITQEFGIMVDENMERMSDTRLPSQWKWCSWQLTRDMMKCGLGEHKLSSRLSELFHCDGKCNTNNGDDQIWSTESFGYTRVKSDEFVVVEGMYELEDNIWTCPMKMTSLYEGIGSSPHTDKVNLCKWFEVLMTDCSGFVDECLEDIAIKEVVWSSLLMEVLETMKNQMKQIERKLKNPDYFGDFSYKNCPQFGGVISSASSIFPSSLLITSFLSFLNH